tara:strand:+ start:182 stop:583 length:402 start_codon:yes stop_codon:yes gene_type:complete
MFTRTRDIGDDAGARLRISVAPHPAGAMVTLERRDQRHRPSIWLNLYGAEILSGFLMAARLSVPHPMPDEIAESACPTRFRLDCSPAAQVIVEQDEAFPLIIGSALWDRLYAELCLVTAHGRELARRVGVSLH